MNKEDFINEMSKGFSKFSLIREKLESTIFIKGESFILSHLNECKISTPGALADALDVSPARIAAILRSLERKKLVKRGVDSKDKRRVIVKLTQKGTEFVEKLKADIDNQAVALFEILGENDATEFVRLLKKISENKLSV